MDRVRIDRWLWAARFFKTRALAQDAVVGGHVRVNGERVKPARDVRADDVIEVRVGEVVRTVVVLGGRGRWPGGQPWLAMILDVTATVVLTNAAYRALTTPTHGGHRTARC